MRERGARDKDKKRGRERQRERGGERQRERQISEVKLRKKQNPSRRFSLDFFHFFSLFHSVWMIIDQSTSR